MVCGIVNGGLGLKLAGNTKGGKIAYIVVAAVMGVTYIAVVVLKRRGKGAKTDDGVGRRRAGPRMGRREKRDVVETSSPSR